MGNGSYFQDSDSERKGKRGWPKFTPWDIYSLIFLDMPGPSCRPQWVKVRFDMVLLLSEWA